MNYLINIKICIKKHSWNILKKFLNIKIDFQNIGIVLPPPPFLRCKKKQKIYFPDATDGIVQKFRVFL